MAAIQEADISEQKEIVLTSETEQKNAPSQSLDITLASGQEKTITTIQLLKGEPWPIKPKKSREEIKIQKLKDITVSQDKKITNLEKELVETMEALFKEREATKQLCVKVRQQKETITKQQVEVRHFKSETKKNKKEKEAAIAQFSKAELDKNDLTEMLRSVGKEGCEINQTLKEERSKNEEQMRILAEVQSKAGKLQSEVVELHNEVAKLQNNVAGLKSKNAKLQDMNFAQGIDIKLFRVVSKETERQMFSMAVDHAEQKATLESEISEYKVSVHECKLALKEATTKLEKTKNDNKIISQRLRTYKARSDRRGKIIQADKGTKAEMEETIETLKKENEKLQAKMNSGFIGRYRSIKRFLGRVIDALLSPF